MTFCLVIPSKQKCLQEDHVYPSLAMKKWVEIQFTIKPWGPSIDAFSDWPDMNAFRHMVSITGILIRTIRWLADRPRSLYNTKPHHKACAYVVRKSETIMVSSSTFPHVMTTQKWRVFREGLKYKAQRRYKDNSVILNFWLMNSLCSAPFRIKTNWILSFMLIVPVNFCFMTRLVSLHAWSFEFNICHIPNYVKHLLYLISLLLLVLCSQALD